MPIYRFLIKTRRIKLSNLHIKELKTHFSGKEKFGTKDLIDFYKSFEPEISQTTVNWRIYTLTQQGMLHRIGRGKFSMNSRKHYTPYLSEKLRKTGKILRKQFPFLETCIWSTSAFNEFMVHQPGRFYFLVEVEKEATQAVFFSLKEKHLNVFMNPDQKTLDLYLSDEKEAWIVRPLVSEAPTQELDGTQTTTLEKMLTDAFCDKEIFAAQQGRELKRIFKEADNKYIIHRDRLLRYAARRGRKDQLKEFLNNI